MNKIGKIVASIIWALGVTTVLFVIMGQLAWTLLKIEQEAPLNAWWLLFNHPNPVAKGMAIKVLIIPGIFVLLLPILLIAGMIKKKKRWVHGKARLAKFSDIKAAKLFAKDNKGIFLGFFLNRCLNTTL